MSASFSGWVRRSRASFGWRVESLNWSGVLLVALGTVCLFTLIVTPARAHHVGGSGGAARLGGVLGDISPAVQSRVLLSVGLSRQSSPAGAQWLSSPTVVVEDRRGDFSWGAALPYIVRWPDSAAEQHGFGDAGLRLRWTPHSDKLRHRVWTYSVGLGVPTSTVKYELASGAIWRAEIGASFTRSYREVFWQAGVQALGDTRPAGEGFSLGGNALLGYAWPGSGSIAAGVLGQVRAVNLCADASGSRRACPGPRATEWFGERGDIQIHGLLRASWQPSPSTLIWGAKKLSIKAPHIEPFHLSVGVGLLF